MWGYKWSSLSCAIIRPCLQTATCKYVCEPALSLLDLSNAEQDAEEEIYRLIQEEDRQFWPQQLRNIHTVGPRPEPVIDLHVAQHLLTKALLP